MLTWATIRLDADGYQQIDPKVRVVQLQRTATVTHLKLNVDADQSLYKPPPFEKFQSLHNETSNSVTTSSKTIQTTAPTTTTHQTSSKTK